MKKHLISFILPLLICVLICVLMPSGATAAFSISIYGSPRNGEPGDSFTFNASVQPISEDGSSGEGQTVTFSVSPADGTVSLSTTSATTDSNGQAQTTLRTGSGLSGENQEAILALEQLLSLLTPKQTALLANYPNPFNPETWIPYHLANDTDVQISIYNISGALVRQLDLGHQRPGDYTNRSRAEYWDGRNGSGERVASGVYFYTLSADTFRATRKMLIGK